MLEVLVATAAPQPAAVLAPWLHAADRDGRPARTDPADVARSRTGRALLRALVARATGRDPATIAFRTRCPVCAGAHGRPQVVGRPAPFTSVAHAGDVVLVAVAPVPIGLDVERCSAGDFDGFDDVALTSAERAGIASLPAEARLDARTAIWVRKEAVLKRHEVGLSVDPRGVEIGLGEDDRVIADPVSPGRIALAGLAVPDGYRAALAVAGGALPTVTTLEAPSLWAGPAPRPDRASG